MNHGSRSTYANQGCRCDPCKTAHAAYQMRWKAGERPGRSRDERLARVRESYPRTIRDRLTDAKARGLDFAQAWEEAFDMADFRVWVRNSHADDGEREKFFAFFTRVFTLAYAGRSLSIHPIRVEPPDPAPDGAYGADSGVKKASAPKRTKQRTQPCRSGDRCSESATHGTWGPRFCQAHYEQLHRIVGTPTDMERAMANHHAKLAAKAAA